MTDEFYGCCVCGAVEEWRTGRFGQDVSGALVELDVMDAQYEDGVERQVCAACGAVEPETFLHGCWGVDE